MTVYSGPDFKLAAGEFRTAEAVRGLS